MIYLFLGRTGYLRNTAYRWSHMLNNVASAMFGFIYISLWNAVAPQTPAAGDPYSRQVMLSIMVLAQVIAWFTTFLPAGLQIHNSIRTGAIALEMARPVPFFPQVMAREAGNIAYHAVYRALPLALIFLVTVGFPPPGSAQGLLLALPSLLLGIYIGLAMNYLIGISALWTTEIRWAHWTYHTLMGLLSGGWIPSDILPGLAGQVAPYLPFASQQHWPIRIYLGMAGTEGLLIQATWALLMTLLCLLVTRRALRRVVVQGG